MPAMLTSYAMKSHAGIFISVRKAAVRAGFNCTPTHLGAPRSCHVGIKCLDAIYGAAGAPEIISRYWKVEKTLEDDLSFPIETTGRSLAVDRQ